ncbi:hypothetical protein C8A00DRAFT_31156 [Chaetomidium leptoderma]|uniref:Uncharacterized protein n=1 Tax=Chaetomidium leptoderma TaxID=669021 RepID=A0AAN6ZZK5_9PEZI|nr:hypothetical protein C8A00DRAFT_31156 [Chaetomidium leptoderma]
MDPTSAQFIPPLLVSVPTGRVSFDYVGADAQWRSPHLKRLRSARDGHLSIYGSHDGNFSRVAIAVSFEEDDLPTLNRQVYYHYLQGENSFTMADNQVEFVFDNHLTVEDESESYKRTIAWRIQFPPGALETVRSLLEKINTSGSWRHMATISSLPADERSVLYYNLRSALIEQPIPERLGALGHWQNRLPGGTPSHIPYMEDRYRAKNIELCKSAVADAAEHKRRLEEIALAAQLASDTQIVPDQPEWGFEGFSSGSDRMQMDEEGEEEEEKEEEDGHLGPIGARSTRIGKKPAANIIPSPPASNEGSPKNGKKQQRQQQHMANCTMANHFDDGNGGIYAASESGLSSTPFPAGITAANQWDGKTAHSPSLGGSPRLAIRAKRFRNERKVSMNAVVDLGDGKETPLQVVMAEDMVRQLSANAAALRAASPVGFGLETISFYTNKDQDGEGHNVRVV